MTTREARGLPAATIDEASVQSNVNNAKGVRFIPQSPTGGRHPCSSARLPGHRSLVGGS